MLRVPVPGAEVFDSIQRLYNQIENMRDLLLDHSNSSVRLVMNPEKMVIKEAQRTFTYLNLYGYHTDLVICNRVLSAEMGDGFFSGWKETHDRYLKLIHDSFDPVPVLTAPLMDREVVGLEALKDLGEHLFGQGPAMSIAKGDPTKVFHEGPVQEISSENGQYLLTLRLPFTSREDLSVIESRDELVLQVGQYRRNIILPRALVGLGVEDAQTVKDNDASTLRVRFHRQKEA
jgi:arsenite-transporting ATPase